MSFCKLPVALLVELTNGQYPARTLIDLSHFRFIFWNYFITNQRLGFKFNRPLVLKWPFKWPWSNPLELNWPRMTSNHLNPNHIPQMSYFHFDILSSLNTRFPNSFFWLISAYKLYRDVIDYDVITQFKKFEYFITVRSHQIRFPN